MRYLAIAAYAACIPAANWLIGHIGTECIPNGPCLVPVGFGLSAPSGVLMIGAALVLRDLVQEKFGATWSAAAVVAGACLSAFVAPPALAVASGAAFLASELLDLAVYTPLRRRHLGLAVAASGIAGAIVDSALFLWLAFGSLQFIDGQVLGKLWMSALAGLALWLLAKSKERPA